MQGNVRRLIAACLIISSGSILGGCSLFEKPVNTRPPKPLKPIKTTLHVKKMWSVSLGSGNGGYLLRLHPWVDQGIVYAVDQAGDVYAVKASNGDRLWSLQTHKYLTSGVSGGDGKLFVGTQKGNVVGLSIKNRKILWQTHLNSEVMAISKPAQGEVIAHTNAGDLVAIDVSTGNIVWSQGVQSPKLILRGKTRPVISGTTVLSGFSTGRLSAFNISDGSPVWQLHVAQPSGASELQQMVDISNHIAVVDGVVFASSYHGKIIAATLGKGQKLWSHPMSSYAGLTVGSKAVYVSDSHSDIWALDIGTGASLWKQSALHFRQLTAPVIVDNALVVGDYEGYLHWLALNNGKFIARKHVTDSAIEVPPVVKGHNLYVQAANGVLAKYTVGSSHTAKSKSSATHSTNSNSSGSMF